MLKVKRTPAIKSVDEVIITEEDLKEYGLEGICTVESYRYSYLKDVYASLNSNPGEYGHIFISDEGVPYICYKGYGVTLNNKFYVHGYKQSGYECVDSCHYLALDKLLPGKLNREVAEITSINRCIDLYIRRKCADSIDELRIDHLTKVREHAYRSGLGEEFEKTFPKFKEIAGPYQLTYPNLMSILQAKL